MERPVALGAGDRRVTVAMHLASLRRDIARTAHINGQIPAALAQVSADLLAREPDIRPVNVLAVK